MNQRTLTEIVQLSNAANRLLQSVRDQTPSEHVALIHKNSKAVLNQIEALLVSEALIASATPVTMPAPEGVQLPPGAVILTLEQIMEANIGLLPLPTRLEVALKKAGLVKIRHLCGTSPEAIRSIDSVGSVGLQKIIEALVPFGLTITD